MAISLQSKEHQLLTKFAVFYFGVTFILLTIIFWLIYSLQADTQKNLAIAKMKNFSFKLSSNIIESQMNKKPMNCSAAINSRYKFMLLDKNGKRITGDKIDKKGLVINDKSPLGHMGVWSIVVEDTTFPTLHKRLIYKTIVAFILSYLVIALLGYYLIRLFLKPIKEARERLDNFIKDTTHELNTPITALLMCANSKSIKNPKNVDRIRLSAKRVSELYKDLTYIFLEEKNRKLEKFQMRELIDELISYFDILAHKKGVKITTSLDNSTIEMDREDFKRLFSNLLSNTIKYNKRGGQVNITLKNGTITIIDSGIGIEKEDKNRIFDKYYRATNQEGGFGIGLSIVKQICKDYNIDITVDSTLGKGTTFTLKFPAY